jgi:hypothetical protein
MPRGGAGAGLAYAARPDGHQVLVLRAAPRLDSVALDVEQLLPAQLPRRHGPAETGARALLVRLLGLALLDAGFGAPPVRSIARQVTGAAVNRAAPRQQPERGRHRVASTALRSRSSSSLRREARDVRGGERNGPNPQQQCD